MTNEYDRSMELKETSENEFRHICDDNGFSYMYIDQGKMTFSSGIWKSMSKRPDFLLSLPHIGSIFVDVKAYKESIFFKDVYKKMNAIPPKAFKIPVEEIFKYQVLQNETSLKVWFAIMPVQDDTITKYIYFIPIDRVERFISSVHRKNLKWSYTQVPVECFTDINRLTQNKCVFCKMKYCEKLEELQNKVEL
jgi:hypothetical protein